MAHLSVLVNQETRTLPLVLRNICDKDDSFRERVCLYEYYCIMIMSRSSRSWPPKRSNRYPCLVQDSSSGGDERINPRKNLISLKNTPGLFIPVFYVLLLCF